MPPLYFLVPSPISEMQTFVLPRCLNSTGSRSFHRAYGRKSYAVCVGYLIETPFSGSDYVAALAVTRFLGFLDTLPDHILERCSDTCIKNETLEGESVPNA